jgi:hypothetical protein
MKIEKELSEIRQIYAGADKNGKALMEKLYSKAVLGDVRTRITSFETACAELGVTVPIFLCTKDEEAHGKLKTITKALNEGWTPDWNDSDQCKYYPWFDFRGGRFVFRGVDCYYTASLLGSRLCFRSRELAEYAGKQFEDLYNQFLK